MNPAALIAMLASVNNGWAFAAFLTTPSSPVLQACLNISRPSTSKLSLNGMSDSSTSFSVAPCARTAAGSGDRGY